MKITFNDYIQNPAGKNNAVFSQREMFRSLYASKLDKIILRENNKIDYKLYYTNNNEYYIHIKIPSEVIEKFYYDVVVKFYTDNPSLSIETNLQKYYVKFYSNDPSFVYTYAHTFMEHDLFIDELKDRMSKLAIKKAAEEKNPNNVVGYVKSLFFCYLIMKNKGLFVKTKYSMYGTKFNKSQLLKEIEPADEKIDKRRKAEEEKKKKNRTSKENEKPRDNKHFVPSSPQSSIKSNMKTTKKTGYVKKTGYTKKK